ncbi:hypothetical protein [Leptospira interrogans]|uniref:hypothetical protein n=1 Tax=Leptospira interrogans TaxID=173 RepID=UPI001F0F8846|nr:hypothetical protein [Leptospira interrogans]UMQ60477.1 hypothetical protein FH585_21385 [Leptospira interrogans]UMQ60571.1 hypothetical protein FH585_21280 [Leptospira interrogans]
MAKSVEINVDTLAKRIFDRLSPEMRAEFERLKNTPTVPTAADPPSSSRKNSKKNNKNKTATEGYQTGDNTGTGIESDINELRSGRFSGIISRKVDSMKRFKEAFKDFHNNRNKKIKDDFFPKMPEGLGPGDVGGGRYDKLIVREAKIDKIVGPLGGKPGDGGKPKFLPPSGFPEDGIPKPAASPQTENKSSMLSKVGAAIAPAAFGVGAVLGAAVSVISSMAGMHQQAMQSQDSTLDVYDRLHIDEDEKGNITKRRHGYIGGGGALVKNAEFAQIGVSRARILDGDAQKAIDDISKNKLGIQFGLSQGIGGAQGSELFAKLNKYGSFDEKDSELKKILSDAIRSGFSGLRQSEFFTNIASASESAYNSGMGTQSAADITRTFSNIVGLGIRENRANSVYQNLNDNVSKNGNFFNSVLVSEHMASGKSALEAKSLAEKGISDKDNVKTIRDFMSSLGLSDDTKGLLLNQLGITTATESFDMKKNSKISNFFDLDNETSTDERGINAGGKISDVQGQDYRGRANELDEMAANTKMFIQANEAQKRIFITIINSIKFMDEKVKELEGYFK